MANGPQFSLGTFVGNNLPSGTDLFKSTADFTTAADDLTEDKLLAAESLKSIKQVDRYLIENGKEKELRAGFGSGQNRRSRQPIATQRQEFAAASTAIGAEPTGKVKKKATKTKAPETSQPDKKANKPAPHIQRHFEPLDAVVKRTVTTSAMRLASKSAFEALLKQKIPQILEYVYYLIASEVPLRRQGAWVEGHYYSLEPGGRRKFRKASEFDIYRDFALQAKHARFNPPHEFGILSIQIVTLLDFLFERLTLPRLVNSGTWVEERFPRSEPANVVLYEGQIPSPPYERIQGLDEMLDIPWYDNLDYDKFKYSEETPRPNLIRKSDELRYLRPHLKFQGALAEAVAVTSYDPFRSLEEVILTKAASPDQMLKMAADVIDGFFLKFPDNPTPNGSDHYRNSAGGRGSWNYGHPLAVQCLNMLARVLVVLTDLEQNPEIKKARAIAAAEVRRVQEAKAAEARRIEEARAAAERRRVEEARVAKERRQAEERRLAEERRQAEEARRAAETEARRKAEEERLAAEALRRAEEAKAAIERVTGQVVGQAKIVNWIKSLYQGLSLDEQRRSFGDRTETVLHGAWLHAAEDRHHTSRSRELARVYQSLLLPHGKIVSLDASTLSPAEDPSVSNLTNLLLGNNDRVVVISNVNELAAAIASLKDFDRLDGMRSGVRNGSPWARIMAHLSQRPSNTVVILDGTKEEIDSLFAAHRDFARLFDHNQIAFEPYSDKELAEILKKQAAPYRLDEKAKKAAAERLKGKTGYEDEALDLLQEAREALTARLYGKGGAKSREELTQFIAADFGGETKPIQTATADKIDAMIGLNGAKKVIKQIIATARAAKFQREQGNPVPKPSFHSVFVGNPGTGKTEMAGNLAQILKESGMLRTDKIVKRTAAELVGSHVGQAEENTKKAFDEARGGVLFIDEAHQLGSKDSLYGRKVIETLVPLMETHRDDVVVIFACYPGTYMDGLMKVDPGLKDRFKYIVPFENYSEDELADILKVMMRGSGQSTTTEGLAAARSVLAREKSGRDFANGRAVRNLLERAIGHRDAQLFGESTTAKDLDFSQAAVLSAENFLGDNPPQNFDPEAELAKFYGNERAKEALDELIAVVEEEKAAGRDPLDAIDLSFIFEGPPGVGKSWFGAIAARFLYGLGLIARPEVIEMSATQLTGQFVGQTPARVAEILERSLGAFLFIDEIDGLVDGGGFIKDIINVLLPHLEKNKKNGAVAIAGYPHSVARFLAQDPGLPSRFKNTIPFDPYDAEAAAKFFRDKIVQKKRTLSPEAERLLESELERLLEAPNWASARDVDQLTSVVIRKQAVLSRKSKSGGSDILSAEALFLAVDEMIGKKVAYSAGGLDPASPPPPNVRRQSQTHTQAPPPVVIDLAPVTATHREQSVITEEDHAFDQALNDIVRKLDLAADQVNQNLLDENSELVREISQATNQTPKQIVDRAQKIMKLVKVPGTCPICGAVAPTCPGANFRKDYSPTTYRMMEQSGKTSKDKK